MRLQHRELGNFTETFPGEHNSEQSADHPQLYYLFLEIFVDTNTEDCRPSVPLENLGFLFQNKINHQRTMTLDYYSFACFLRVLLCHYKLGKETEDV